MAARCARQLNRSIPGLSRLLRRTDDSDLIVPFIFLDAGFGGTHRHVAGLRHSWIALVSARPGFARQIAGPGFAWQIAGPGFARQIDSHVTLRATWGFPLLCSGQTGPLPGPQFALQLNF